MKLPVLMVFAFSLVSGCSTRPEPRADDYPDVKTSHEHNWHLRYMDRWFLIELPEGSLLVTSRFLAYTIEAGSLIEHVDGYRYRTQDGVWPSDIMEYLASSGKIKKEGAEYLVGDKLRVFTFTGKEYSDIIERATTSNTDAIVKNLDILSAEYAMLDLHEQAILVASGLRAGCVVFWVPREMRPTFSLPNQK